MRLLTSQKNSLYEIIERKGLSPSSFQFEEARSLEVLGEVDTFLHFNQMFHFVFRSHSNQDIIIVEYSPGQHAFKRTEYVSGWFDAQKHFTIWSECLFNELTQIDKWQRLNDELNQINITYSGEDDKFSASEYEELKTQMLFLKERIKQINLLPEQLIAIENKIDHLTVIAKSLSKFDWKGLFVGTFVSIIIQLGVTQENAKAIWDAIKLAFTKYFLLP